VQLPMGNRKTERLGGLEVQDHRRADRITAGYVSLWH
jgi:hypothetical protein